MEQLLEIDPPPPAQRDDRKSGDIALKNDRIPDGFGRLTRFSQLRTALRSPRAIQAMHGGDMFKSTDPDQIPVAFLDGEIHRTRRAGIAKFFTPKMILTRYTQVIESTCDRLLGELRANGSAKLDVIAFELAANVVISVLGLTETDSRAVSKRLRGFLEGGLSLHKNRLVRAWGGVLTGLRLQIFWHKDVSPAVATRRLEPKEDIISHMIAKNYTKRAMLVECFIYGMAGMTTTRELMTMAAWHMLEDAELKRAYLNSDEAGQLAIVEEILRLEPITSQIYRAIPDHGPNHGPNHGEDDGLTPGEYVLDIRSANCDPDVVGANPHAIDPDRAQRMKVPGSYMSFGDGPHRCPGAQLALHETRIFLDRLLRLPGLKLSEEPHMGWSYGVHGFELREAIVTCDRG
jgi:cytochrome P450